MALEVDVQLGCDAPEIPPQAEIRRWVEAALAATGDAASGEIELAVRVVDAEESRTLNRRYRDQDKPTNVLSFPAQQLDGLPEAAGRLLGDVVICAPVVAAEAVEQGKTVADHWGHMLVHGTLHLLGFDHQTDAEAEEMEALERQILAAGSVTDPYARS